MSKKCWLEALHKILSEHKTPGRDSRLAIAGIGHELCGDDALGIVISQELENRLGKMVIGMSLEFNFSEDFATLFAPLRLYQYYYSLHSTFHSVRVKILS